MISETEKQELIDMAEKGKILYNSGQISRNEAKEYIMPYLNMANERSAEIANKYNMKPKRISFNEFIR